DPHGQLPFLLEANGQLREKFVVDRMDVHHYSLHSWQTPPLAPMRLDCGPLRLSAAYVPANALPGDAPAIALQWRLLEATELTLVASARLMDGDHQLSSLDHKLLDEAEESTEKWAPGAEAM